jgi:hypothetical protein
MEVRKYYAMRLRGSSPFRDTASRPGGQENGAFTDPEVLLGLYSS